MVFKPWQYHNIRFHKGHISVLEMLSHIKKFEMVLVMMACSISTPPSREIA